MVNLIAKSSFPYNGRSIKSGDLFEAVSEQDANILRLGGKAEDAPRLRKTSTKDMTAEEPYNPQVLTDAIQRTAEKIDRRTRAYRRRDLVPEP